MSSTFLKYSLVIVASGAIIISVLYGMDLGNACSIKQIGIIGDLKKYDQTKDPELCSQINNEVSRFDNDCKGNLETLDCG